jgi:ABC-type glycerol-3-phosphate transport system substrate-binding protein
LVHQSNANVKIVYLPVLKEEVANGTYLSGSGLGLSSQSKQAAAATAFFKYLWSEPVASQMIAGTHLPFTNVKALNSPANASDPILGPEVQMLSNPNSVSINPFPNMEQAQEALANEIANYILGKKSAKQALDDAAATWDKLRMQQ